MRLQCRSVIDRVTGSVSRKRLNVFKSQKETPPQGRRRAGDTLAGVVSGNDSPQGPLPCQGEKPDVRRGAQMSRVIVYIDGFNLYFALRSKGWRKYYWLDLARLAQKLIKP
jgi:hypothetical protein